MSGAGRVAVNWNWREGALVWQIVFKWEDCLVGTFVLSDSPALLILPGMLCLVAPSPSLKFHASMGKTADCNLCPPLPHLPLPMDFLEPCYTSSDFFLQPVLF